MKGKKNAAETSFEAWPLPFYQRLHKIATVALLALRKIIFPGDKGDQFWIRIHRSAATESKNIFTSFNFPTANILRHSTPDHEVTDELRHIRVVISDHYFISEKLL